MYGPSNRKCSTDPREPVVHDDYDCTSSTHCPSDNEPDVEPYGENENDSVYDFANAAVHFNDLQSINETLRGTVDPYL